MNKQAKNSILKYLNNRYKFLEIMRNKCNNKYSIALINSKLSELSLAIKVILES